MTNTQSATTVQTTLPGETLVIKMGSNSQRLHKFSLPLLSIPFKAFLDHNVSSAPPKTIGLLNRNVVLIA